MTHELNRGGARDQRASGPARAAAAREGSVVLPFWAR